MVYAPYPRADADHCDRPTAAATMDCGNMSTLYATLWAVPIYSTVCTKQIQAAPDTASAGDAFHIDIVEEEGITVASPMMEGLALTDISPLVV